MLTFLLHLIPLNKVETPAHMYQYISYFEYLHALSLLGPSLFTYTLSFSSSNPADFNSLYAAG